MGNVLGMYTKFKFQYNHMDIQEAAKKRGVKRKDVIIKEEIEIYPDTTVWIRDFATIPTMSLCTMIISGMMPIVIILL